MAAVEELPVHDRLTQWTIAHALGVSQGTISYIYQFEKIILPHSSAIKPHLTDKDILDHFSYAADHIVFVKGTAYFHDQFDELHVDKKWFFLSEETLRYYITEREKDDNKVVKVSVTIQTILKRLCFLQRLRGLDLMMMATVRLMERLEYGPLSIKCLHKESPRIIFWILRNQVHQCQKESVHAIHV